MAFNPNPGQYKTNEEYANAMFAKLPTTIFYGNTVVKTAWSDDVFTTSSCYTIPSVSFDELYLLSQYLLITLESSPAFPDHNFPSTLITLAAHLFSTSGEGSSSAPRSMFTLPAGTQPLPINSHYASWREEETKRSGKTISNKGSSSSEMKVRVAITKFCCFFAAFLLRLCVKEINDLKGSMGVMEARFFKFYRTKDHMKYLPKITSNKVGELRSLLSYDRLLAITWLRVVVPYYETTLDKSDNEWDMLNYLAILHFSFSGMHALKLFEEILAMSNLKDSYLLRQLMHPSHNKALEAIGEIYAHHYPTDVNPNKPGYVRYARVMGSQYYPELQTKRCKSLVATLAQIQAQFVKAGGVAGAGNPMEIKGIADISDSVRAFARRLAKIIIREAPKSDE